MDTFCCDLSPRPAIRSLCAKCGPDGGYTHLPGVILPPLHHTRLSSLGARPRHRARALAHAAAAPARLSPCLPTLPCPVCRVPHQSPSPRGATSCAGLQTPSHRAPATAHPSDAHPGRGGYSLPSPTTLRRRDSVIRWPNTSIRWSGALIRQTCVLAVMVVAAGVLLPSSCRSVSLKGSEKAEASLPATTHKKFLQKEHDMHKMVGEVAKESNFSKACWRRRLESSISENGGDHLPRRH
ncbi:uncharacterized protein [Miscanthus floridulus]|uniref:uncharacterized protein n=1 Tax=Miscanthus floridulus TaxID=154761 RepID=UPI003459C1AE